MTVSKAIVLARGLGTRMRAEAASTPLAQDQADMAAAGLKAMIPVGRPFLDHVLSVLADAGFDTICVVIGPEHGVVRDYYAGLALARLRLVFAEQAAPRGTADAVYAARWFAGDDGFVVVNGDNLYPVASCRALRMADGPALVGFTRTGLLRDGLIAADRLASFAVIDAPDGTYLIYANRSRGDLLKGGFGGLKRKLARDQARKSAEQTLGTIKMVLESAPAAR